MVAVLRTLAAIACAAMLMAAIGCGSSSSDSSGATPPTTTTQKKGVQQLKLQSNPNFVPMQQGGKLNGSSGSN